MKTLLILIGNERGGEDTWETLYLNLVDPLNADMGLFGTFNKNTSLYYKAKYIWNFDDSNSNLIKLHDENAKKKNVDIDI